MEEDDWWVCRVWCIIMGSGGLGDTDVCLMSHSCHLCVGVVYMYADTFTVQRYPRCDLWIAEWVYFHGGGDWCYFG